MSSDRDTTRAVRSWLEEGVTTLPDRVLDGVLDQLPATRQRGSLWRRLTFDRVDANARLAVGATAVLVVVIMGIGLIPALVRPVGGPGAPGPSPSPSPNPTAQPTPAPPTAAPLDETPVALMPGPQSLDGFPVGVSFTVPAGWFLCIHSLLEQSICRESGPDELGFLIVDNVVADPCSGVLLDPPVGPTVDDLVAAISGLPTFTATNATDISVDGFAGKELTVTAPSVPTCAQLLTWATADRTNGVGPAEANFIRIVDVRGTRVVMTAAYGGLDADAAAQLEAMVQIMDSVRFTP